MSAMGIPRPCTKARKSRAISRGLDRQHPYLASAKGYPSKEIRQIVTVVEKLTAGERVSKGKNIGSDARRWQSDRDYFIYKGHAAILTADASVCRQSARGHRKRMRREHLHFRADGSLTGLGKRPLAIRSCQHYISTRISSTRKPITCMSHSGAPSVFHVQKIQPAPFSYPSS